MPGILTVGTNSALVGWSVGRLVCRLVGRLGIDIEFELDVESEFDLPVDLELKIDLELKVDLELKMDRYEKLTYRYYA